MNNLIELLKDPDTVMDCGFSWQEGYHEHEIMINAMEYLITAGFNHESKTIPGDSMTAPCHESRLSIEILSIYRIEPDGDETKLKPTGEQVELIEKWIYEHIH